MSDRHKTDPISLRLPAGLAEFAERAAAAEGKSRHAWLVDLVEAARHGLGDELDQAAELGEPGATMLSPGSEGLYANDEPAVAAQFGWFG